MRRGVLALLYAGYLVLVAYLVWNPAPTVPDGVVLRAMMAVRSLGIQISWQTVEFGLNVLLFVPMSLLGAAVWPRLRVADWVLVGFSASLAVEAVQRLLLPARNGDPRDVVSNTLGALVGALLAWAARAAWRRTTGTPAQASSSTDLSSPGLR